MKITITGHRPQRIKGKETEIKQWLANKFKELKPLLVITGMAQGVDQFAAWECNDKNIPFYCYFPFKRKLYSEQAYLLEQSTGHTWMKEKYEGPQDYIERDRRMVDMGDIVLAVWDGKKVGGTWQTIKYARESGKEVILFPWK